MFYDDTYDVTPSDVRFVHDTIHPQFRNGNSVNDTIDDIRWRRIERDVLLPLEVVTFNKQIYSLNNRRLYVFRVLEYLGDLRTIKVTKISLDFLTLDKCTTENYGRSIEVRRGGTRPHAKATLIAKNSTLENDLIAYRYPKSKFVQIENEILAVTKVKQESINLIVINNDQPENDEASSSTTEVVEESDLATATTNEDSLDESIIEIEELDLADDEEKHVTDLTIVNTQTDKGNDKTLTLITDAEEDRSSTIVNIQPATRNDETSTFKRDVEENRTAHNAQIPPELEDVNISIPEDLETSSSPLPENTSTTSAEKVETSSLWCGTLCFSSSMFGQIWQHFRH